MTGLAQPGRRRVSCLEYRGRGHIIDIMALLLDSGYSTAVNICDVTEILLKAESGVYLIRAHSTGVNNTASFTPVVLPDTSSMTYFMLLSYT